MFKSFMNTSTFISFRYFKPLILRGYFKGLTSVCTSELLTMVLSNYNLIVLKIVCPTKNNIQIVLAQEPERNRKARISFEKSIARGIVVS